MNPVQTRETQGSSPLARGLRDPGRRRGGLGRIIPARAGFTANINVSTWAAADHPRSRGVYLLIRSHARCLSGSSPLARGLPAPRARLGGPSGIIPARAGFTRSRSRSHTPTGDHPRSRGVYSEISGLISIIPWIIPARAGFTRRRLRLPGQRQDHPRSRGVYGSRQFAQHILLGSSPLARGLPPPRPQQERGAGIIPARAGFTAWWRPATWPNADHPRSRGVYSERALWRSSEFGSSPLARGLHAHVQAELNQRRIIPARAGFTW